MLDEQAIMQLVENASPFYLKMATAICRSARMPEEVDDAKQIARIELWKFAQRWDPELNGDFSKAALLRVRGAVIDHLRRTGSRNRTSFEFHNHISLSFKLKGKERMHDVLVAPDPHYALDIPKSWQDLLTPRELQAFKLWIFEDLYMKEIGAAMGVNESRASQLVNKASARLRAAFAEKQAA